MKTHPRRGDEAPQGDDGAQRREERKQLSRRKILDAAREVFFRDGFMAANLDEVARKAGVAKGTLYRYFDSKAELYVAVLAHNGAIFKQRMCEMVSGDAAAADRIRHVSKFYFDHWIRNRDYFQIFWAIENQAVIGELPPGVLGEVGRNASRSSPASFPRGSTVANSATVTRGRWQTSSGPSPTA
jgi:AcrR family transcriptional regulator